MKELRPWLERHVRRAELFAEILGRLTHRYTRSSIHTSGIGEKSSRPYRVVASDDASVVIESTDDLTGQLILFHLHFEGGRYWVSFGLHREWFKRIS